MKKIVAFFISLFVVFSLSNVLYAAPSSVRQVDPTMNVSASSSLRTTATVLADVNLTDVSVTEKEGLYTGQFSLQGKMGMQSDITYGVVVRNSNNAIIEAVKVGEEKVLYEGEIKRYSLIYALPTYFNGEITVNIEAYTKDGLRLGSQKIITKKMNGKGSTLSCVSQVSAIACTSKNNTEMKISLLASGPLGQEILSKVLTFKEGEKVDITKLVAVTSPGNYYISLENQITRERKIIPYNRPLSKPSLIIMHPSYKVKA